MSFARRTFLGPSRLALLLLTPLVCGGIDEAEFECEEAVARLADCCPGLDPRALSCRTPSACDNRGLDLSLEESLCLQELSCESVRATLTCERVVERATADSEAPVCP